MKKNIFKILLIIILLILIVFLSMFIREIYIIEKIKNKAIELGTINNFYYEEQRDFDRFGDSNKYIESRYKDTKISQMGTMKQIINGDYSYTIFINPKVYYEYDAHKTDIDTIAKTENGILVNYFFGRPITENSIYLALDFDVKQEVYNYETCYVVSYEDKENNTIETNYINKTTLLLTERTRKNLETGNVLHNYIDIELNTQKAEDYVLEDMLAPYTKSN